MREKNLKNMKEKKDTYIHDDISASRIAIAMKFSARSPYWFFLALKDFFLLYICATRFKEGLTQITILV